MNKSTNEWMEWVNERTNEWMKRKADDLSHRETALTQVVRSKCGDDPEDIVGCLFLLDHHLTQSSIDRRHHRRLRGHRWRRTGTTHAPRLTAACLTLQTGKDFTWQENQILMCWKTVLHWIVFYCTLFDCILDYSIVLISVLVFYCIAFYCIPLYCMKFCSFVFYCSALLSSLLYSIVIEHFWSDSNTTIQSAACKAVPNFENIYYKVKIN